MIGHGCSRSADLEDCGLHDSTLRYCAGEGLRRAPACAPFKAERICHGDTAPALRERRIAIAQAPVAASGGSGAVGRIASGAPVGRVATPAA